MDHLTTGERVMVAQVPTHGVFTIYSVIGDPFAWLCVLGFLAMALWGVLRWLRLRRGQRTQFLDQEGYRCAARGGPPVLHEASRGAPHRQV